MAVDIGLSVACALCLTLGLFTATQGYVHILQLEGYHNQGLHKHGTKRALLTAAIGLGFAGVYAVIMSLVRVEGLPHLRFCVACVVFAAYSLVVWALNPYKKSKKPLVYTRRVLRLYAVILLLISIYTAGFFFTGNPWFALAYAGLAAAPWAYVMLANWLVSPMEGLIADGFKRKAVKKLAGMPNLKVVGITGSYGKTSSKFILAAILSQKYKTLATPQSFNTPMGVCRAVLEQLTPEHEVFICEMGARRQGDIAELCAMVKPTVGLLTSIGPQHLETFGNMETLADTKFELAQSLPENGISFFPDDGDWGSRLYACARQPKFLFGVGEEADAPLFARATDIQCTPQGSRFTLIVNGESATARTCLLGEHNITNIVGAAGVAHAMGLTLEEIVAGIAEVQPIEHRLQIVRSDSVVVIDDAFNASPNGTRAALAVLARFEGRKIIVTPGLLELGDAELAENQKFGQNMAEVADVVILVGANPRADAMAQGCGEKTDTMAQAGAQKADAATKGGVEKAGLVILRAPTLGDATRQLGGLLKPGDVVLFENDLPDHLE